MEHILHVDDDDDDDSLASSDISLSSYLANIHSDREDQVVPNVLSDLIGDERWEEAAARMRTEEGRKELMLGDYSGCLPLHKACSDGAPPEIVKAMLEEYPEAAVNATVKGFCNGSLPLHIACFGTFVSPQIVRLLLDAYPEGAKVTIEDGALPLHHAAFCRAPLEVLRMLTDAHPEGITTRNNIGELPLHRLAFFGSSDSADDTEKAAFLLKPILENEEACQFSVSASSYPLRGTPLHIAAKFHLLSLRTCTKLPCCPPDVIMMVAARHPRQLSETDESGNLPLHMAAANSKLNGSIDKGEDVIGKLVDLYPEAAAASDGEGRFPLVLAIESGKKWNCGVEALADAATHVITVRDEATNLYPFMLGATVDDPCIDTVYGLFRRCPELKRYVLD